MTNAQKDPQKIKNLFASISQRYDRANDVMTFGMARKWRKKVVRWSRAQPGDSVLDCATGTGDLAIEFKKYLGATSHVVGTDFCKEMLELAPKKAFKKNLKVDFEVADAMNLPFKDNSFNVTSIAYGIRNVSDPVKALSEMARVTKKGGTVMILETGDDQKNMLRPLMRFYFEKIVPRIGAVVTGQKWAYEYLNKSSGTFPAKTEFVELMKQTGQFSKVEFQTLMCGASFVYRGMVN